MGAGNLPETPAPLANPTLHSEGREHNIVASLPQLARAHPDRIAMRCPGRNGRYDIALTYAQLDARSDAIAAGLRRYGIQRDMRAVLMVRPAPGLRRA